MTDTTVGQTLTNYAGPETYGSFDELEDATQPSASTIDALDAIERHCSRVFVNGDGPFYAGGLNDEYRLVDARYLYHDPTNPKRSGPAGELVSKTYTAPGGENEHTVGFQAAGDETITAVESLDTEQHGRTDRLRELLPHLRTELTGTDWVNGSDPKTGYGEWIAAANALAGFVSGQQDGTRYELSPADVQRAPVMHAIARYPLPPVDCLAQVEQCLVRERNDEVEAATPESFRQLLFDYAEANL